jgi:hypothetical protein
LLAFAAASIALVSCAVKRTWITRPFASPFGSLGRPIFFGLFGWLKIPRLLQDCRSNRVLCGFNRVQVKNRNMANGLIRVVGLMCPSIDPMGRRMPFQIEYFHQPFPHRMPLERFFDRDAFNVRCFAAVQSPDYVPQFI